MMDTRKASSMRQSAPYKAAATSKADQARELFNDHLETVHIKTDRMFAVLLAVEWVVGILFAVLISPRAWAGRESSAHPHLLAAIFLGGLVVAFPIALARLAPGRTVTRHAIALSQMLMSALLIHLTGGRIETHFHIFGSLACLGFYRDWRVLVTATLTVAIDHLLRGLFYPQSVYGVPSASLWRTFEHAAWVLFEVFFLALANVNSLKEMMAIADRQAEMEEANQALQTSYARLEDTNSLLQASNSALDSKNLELSQTHKQLDDAHARLRPAFEHLLGVNAILQDTVSRLQALIAVQNSSVNHRNDGLSKAAGKIAEFKRKQSVATARDMLRKAMESTSRTEDFSLESQNAIEKNLAGLEEVRAQMEAIRSTVAGLAERTRKIGSITARVEDFADQSNLLALNATIEAARAGEAGRGFGVVAQEIRDLADRSLQSTHEIRQTLADIEGAIDEAHAITSRGNERVEVGLGAIRSSAENLKNISEFVKATGTTVSTIAESVDDQNAALQQVSEIVTSLEIASGEAERTAADLTSAAKDLDAVAQRIQGAMDLIHNVEERILHSRERRSSPDNEFAPIP